MRAGALLLAACGGGAPSAHVADAPQEAFTYTANIAVRPGITRATMNGAELPATTTDQGTYFVVEETFPDYETGVASPDVVLQFFGGDELDLQGAVGPGLCGRFDLNCDVGTMLGEIVEPPWWQNFTRYQWTEVLTCKGSTGICGLTD